MASRGKVLATLRNVIKELRLISKEAGSKNEVQWKNLHAYNEISSELEVLKNSENEKETENILFTANAYICYLQALNKGKELETLYRGKGERSTEDSAARVGLKLPKLYES